MLEPSSLSSSGKMSKHAGLTLLLYTLIAPDSVRKAAEELCHSSRPPTQCQCVHMYILMHAYAQFHPILADQLPDHTS
jgi:hypothetical protein